MDPFEFNNTQPYSLTSTDCYCAPDLTDMLTVANLSNGMDPLQAALEAQLQAPLIQPFLF
jgi:hypothetical protein